MRTKKVLNKLYQEISCLKENIQELKESVCKLETGHKYTFLGKNPEWIWEVMSYSLESTFVFKCQLCNKRILKQEQDLTKSERRALVALGLLREEKYSLGTDSNSTLGEN